MFLRTRAVLPLTLAATLFALASAPLPAQTSQAVVPNRILAPINEYARVTLHGYVHPLANAANDRGPAPDSMPIEHLHLVLKRSASQEASLQQLIGEMHTPGDPNYHRWLTPAQFGQQFGPSDQDIATVESWLSAHGFQVNGVMPGKQVIDFTGSVAQLRDAFQTQIRKYAVKSVTHFAAASDPQIPAALAPVVGGFVSLNDFRPRSYAHVLGQASYNPTTHAVTPDWTYGSSSGANFVVSPADLAVQYDLNPVYSTDKGQGETIAIINESNINIDLVNQFRTLFGLPANPPTVVIDGNDPGIDGINNPDGPNYASSEAYIDVEWSGAVAPMANVDLVIAADTALENGLYLAAEHAIYSNIAPIMSISFGSCESSLGSTNAYLNQLWEEAAAQGITVMVSAGDNAAAGCDNFNTQYYAVGGAAVSGYASTPWNVAVGGTDFFYSDWASGGASIASYWNTTPSQSPSVSIQSYVPEQPWNDSQFGDDIINLYTINQTTTIAGGSGGASSAAVCAAGYNASTGACGGALTGYPKPSWQTGTGVPADKARDLPDVSLFAADGFNYSFYPFCYADGDCQPASGSSLVQISGAGGTSFASPIFAGIMALVDQKYGPQGQADYVLYPLKAQYPAAFHDITNGSNSVPCNITAVLANGTTYPSVDCINAPSGLNYTVTDPTYGTVTEGQIGNTTTNTPEYKATAGYNLATGLGSVDAAVLISDWGNVHFAASTTTLTPSETSFAHGSSVTISGSVSGPTTPTGTVALMTDSSEPGNQGAGFGQVLAGGQSTFPLTNGSFTGSTTTLPGGTYDIWGQYSGDAANAASASQKTSITVTPENSSIYFNLINTASVSSGSLAVSSGSSVPYGTQAILSADLFPTTYYNNCITPSTPPTSCKTTYFTPPTGTVAFADNGTTINTATVNAEGEAEFNAPFSIGTHSVTAGYSGDNSYNKSTASAITFTVTQATPTIQIAGSTNTGLGSSVSAIAGQILTIQVENTSNSSVESGSSSLGTSTSGVTAAVPIMAPTGTVTVNGLPGGNVTATLSSAVDPSTYFAAGVAAVTIPSSASGNLNLSFSYSGDARYTTATGTQLVSVTAASLKSSSITAKMTGSLSPTTEITVTGTVTGQSGSPAPTGSVQVMGSGNPVTSASLQPGTGDSSTFTLVLNTQTLYQGANIVVLEYTGDKVYSPSAFNLTSSSIISNPLSDFSMTASSTTFPVSSGSGSATLYITPINGFKGNVSLQCAVAGGVPSGVACSLSQSSVSLTFSNTARLAPEKDRLHLLATGGGAVLACVLLLSIPARRRAWRNLLALVLFVCIAGFGVGCGGGGSGAANLGPLGGGSGGGGGGSSAGTATNPSVSVTLKVTATSSVAAGNYGITITGSAGSQIHTLGVIAAVK